MMNMLGRHWRTLAVTSVSLACSYFYSHREQSQLIPRFSIVHAAEYVSCSMNLLLLPHRNILIVG